MPGLEDELRRRVEAARQQDAAKRQADRDAGQVAHEAQERRKAACRELGAMVEGSFKAAAYASDGAMAYRGAAMGGIGVTVYHLEWQAPAPTRVLRITNHYLDGKVEWDWIVNGSEKRGGPADPLEFSKKSIEALILQLADQSRWPDTGSQGSIRTLRL